MDDGVVVQAEIVAEPDDDSFLLLCGGGGGGFQGQWVCGSHCHYAETMCSG